MDNAVDVGAMAIDIQVTGRVRGWLERALDDPTVEVDDDHPLGGQLAVPNSGRLDGDQPAIRVSRADISAGPDRQAAAWQFVVQVGKLMPKRFETHLNAPLRPVRLARPKWRPGQVQPARAAGAGSSSRRSRRARSSHATGSTRRRADRRPRHASGSARRPGPLAGPSPTPRPAMSPV